jgi:hypothetical protein
MRNAPARMCMPRRRCAQRRDARSDMLMRIAVAMRRAIAAEPAKRCHARRHADGASRYAADTLPRTSALPPPLPTFSLPRHAPR